MAAHADKRHEQKSPSDSAVKARRSGGAAVQPSDNRPEAAAHRKLQDDADNSPQAKQLAMTSRILQSREVGTFSGPGPRLVAQLVLKKGPAGTDIDVTEVPDGYVPGCLDSVSGDVKFYRRSDGITEGWNDTDLFYTVENGDLVQLKTETVNAHWDPKYSGFSKVSGPDWTKNCKDYATGGGEPGAKLGDYENAEQLGALLAENGNYVLHLSFHWMKVEKTGANVFTIRQKDGESAVYSKNFTKDGALEYILDKRSDGGTVHRG